MLPTLILATGLLIFLLCIPLIRRKIPRNGLYGIRIPAAFESDERWYAINAHGGRLLALWSWLIVAAGAAGFLVPLEHRQSYAVFSAIVCVIAVFVPFTQVIAWSRRKGP